MLNHIYKTSFICTLFIVYLYYRNIMYIIKYVGITSACLCLLAGSCYQQSPRRDDTHKLSSVTNDHKATVTTNDKIEKHESK